jgi:hypothetical protein
MVNIISRHPVCACNICAKNVGKTHLRFVPEAPTVLLGIILFDPNPIFR